MIFVVLVVCSECSDPKVVAGTGAHHHLSSFSLCVLLADLNGTLQLRTNFQSYNLIIHCSNYLLSFLLLSGWCISSEALKRLSNPCKDRMFWNTTVDS